MRSYRFYQVDVFTDRPFGGNPLAVFPDAAGLSDEEMGQLTREMNLSETTFVLPPKAPGADFRVRIFTPAKELPFAGHPVVGTHWLLAHLGRVRLQEPTTVVRFELGVGVLPATLHVRDGRVDRVVMTQGKPVLGEEIDDIAGLARGLALPEAALLDTGLRPQVVSTGIPQLMIPIRSLEEVQAIDVATMDTSALNRVSRAAGVDTVMVFARSTVRPDADVHVRLFAPMLGIPEDPATGSANGALGAYLVAHGLVPLGSSSARIVSEQGAEMGRPSTVFVEVDHEGGLPVTVRVGGQVVLLIEGTVTLP